MCWLGRMQLVHGRVAGEGVVWVGCGGHSRVWQYPKKQYWLCFSSSRAPLSLHSCPVACLSPQAAPAWSAVLAALLQQLWFVSVTCLCSPLLTCCLFCPQAGPEHICVISKPCSTSTRCVFVSNWLCPPPPPRCPFCPQAGSEGHPRHQQARRYH